MNLQHRTRRLIRRLQEDQLLSLSIAFLILVAYLAKYAYGLYPESEITTDYFPFADVEINMRKHAYYIGERFFIMILFFIIHRLCNSWLTLILWLMETLYIFDYLLTFHESYFGEVKMVIIGSIFTITMLNKWKM